MQHIESTQRCKKGWSVTLRDGPSYIVVLFLEIVNSSVNSYVKVVTAFIVIEFLLLLMF